MQARTRADDATVRAKTRRLSGTPEPQRGKPVAEAPRTPLLKGPQGRGEPKRKVPTPPETPPGRGPSLPAASPSRRRPRRLGARSRDQRARGEGGAGRRGDEAAHPAQDPPLNAGGEAGPATGPLRPAGPARLRRRTALPLLGRRRSRGRAAGRAPRACSPPRRPRGRAGRAPPEAGRPGLSPPPTRSGISWRLRQLANVCAGDTQGPHAHAHAHPVAGLPLTPAHLHTHTYTPTHTPTHTYTPTPTHPRTHTPSGRPATSLLLTIHWDGPRGPCLTGPAL